MINGNACFAYFNKIWGIPAGPISSLTLDLPFVTQQVSLFQRIWPMAALAAAAIVNLAWMCLLGYAFFKLVMWI